jgi:predicted O-linked N-acetylglucosamine transferase (SPINDLY family)/glycosyltransferase involved in cell wall biosynthesis
MDVDNSKNSSRRLSKPVRITEQIWPDDVLPLVSICCFTYNHKDFIEEAIEGFLMQETTFPVEIIIRDDASTDGTSQIVKNYSKKYPQIIKPILLAENQYSQRREAFTKIHSVARGNYIALCEGDDYWAEPTKLQKQIFLLEQNSTSSFCFHNTLIVNQKMQVSGQLRPNTASLMHSVEELLGSNFIHTSSIVFRKSMRPEFPEWYSKAPMGDWPFCILLAEKGNFLYINEVMSHYRLHGQSSWSSQSQAIRCAKTVHLFDLLKDHFAKKPELLAKVNKGFIMHCLNAAKEFKNLNDAENANFFHEKVIEALTGIELSERVKVRHPSETYKESIDSIKTPQAQVESKAKEDAPLVSVCIPTFNGELFIKKTVLSAISQTYSNIEIIISDDSSTDKTCEIAEHVLQDAKFPYRILKHARLGLVENWNFCIEEAKGKYIKFLFQDDHLEPACVQSLIEVADSEVNIGLVFSRRGVESVGGAMIPSDSIDLHKGWSRIQRVQNGSDLLRDPKLLANPINKVGEPTTVLLRKEVLQSLGGFDPNLRQLVDVDMWLRIMMGSKVGFVDEQLSVFRLHQGQATRDNVKAGIIQRDWECFYRKLAESAEFKNLPTFNKRLAAQMLQKISEKSLFPATDAGVIGAWCANPTDPQLLEKISALRLRIAQSIPSREVGCNNGFLEDKSEDSYARLLLSGIQSEFISAEQHEFLLGLTSDELSGDKPSFFAKALFKPAHLFLHAEVPDFTKLPKGFLHAFWTYLFKAPEVFQNASEAEIYSAHLLHWLRDAVRRIEKEPSSPFTKEIASALMQSLNVIPSYCTPAGNGELMALRARVIEFTLGNSGLKLDMPPQSKAPRRAGQKIRVGVLNSHFGVQTETFVTLPALHLDKNRFEVHLFCGAKNPGPVEDRCRSLAKGFHLLPESIQERVQMIRNAKLDILIIGTNITAVTNQIALLAAFRMAPIQVISHCSPMTSGFKNSDAFLSGSLAYREGVSEAEFSEKLILLDGPPVCLDYSCESAAPGLVPPDRSRLGIPADAVVFFNAASCYKIPLELLHLWARLLKEVPNSVLCLLPFNPNWASKLPETRFRGLLELVLAEHGVEKNRVVLGPMLPNRAAVMNFERIADVYLDTMPFSGSISTVDPLQLGTPVVACDGETTRSRCSGAQLRELGLDELVAQNEEEYFAKALHLARDDEYRSGISSRIKLAMSKGPRFLNPEEYGRNLGNALEVLIEEGLGALDDPKAFAQKVNERCSSHSGDSRRGLAMSEITISDAQMAFAEGRLSDAEDICREILGKDERCAGAWRLLGKMAALQGDLDAAGEFVSVACELDSQNAEFIRDLAEVFLRKKELESAEQHARRALELSTDSPEGLVLLGRILAEKDDKPAALEAFQEGVRIRKDYAEGLSYYALALQKFGRGKDAISQIRKACALEPESVEFQTNLAILLEQNARYVDALAAYGKAARMNPDVGFVLFRQGKLLNGLKRYAESVTTLEKAIALPGQLGDYHYEYGLALHMSKRFQEALVHYEKALSMGYNTAAIHCNRGVIYKDLRRGGDAILAFHKAVKMEPTNVSYLNNLGAAALEIGLNSEALECFEQAVEKNPKLPTAHNNIGNLLKDRARGMDALPHYRTSIELNPDDRDAPSNYLLCHMYIPDMDPKVVFEEHKKWGISTAKKFPQAFKFKPREAGSKIRVGFLSADLCHHPVAHFIEPIFREYDRERFEFVAYGDQRKSDDFSARFAKQVDLWRETSSYDDLALAKLIHEDRVDILFELAGHTAYNRLGVFALKPAPVQVSYLGYPGTTGLPAIDFRITDAFADPQGKTDHFHTEKLIRVPECAWCFQPGGSTPEVEPLPALKKGYVTFGCFNNMAKLNPALFEVWAEILILVPGSHLRLKARTLTDEGVRKELMAYFTERGIEENRLEFFGHTKKTTDHLSHYHSVDIALDSFPYHGTTTTCEAMWMGCPVVTRAGKVHVSRVGVSLLNAVGIQEFIAETREDYIQKAVDLAGDLNKLNALRSTLRETMKSSVLMNESVFVRGFEASLVAALPKLRG